MVKSWEGRIHHRRAQTLLTIAPIHSVSVCVFLESTKNPRDPQIQNPPTMVRRSFTKRVHTDILWFITSTAEGREGWNLSDQILQKKRGRNNVLLKSVDMVRNDRKGRFKIT